MEKRPVLQPILSLVRSQSLPSLRAPKPGCVPAPCGCPRISRTSRRGCAVRSLQPLRLLNLAFLTQRPADPLLLRFLPLFVALLAFLVAQNLWQRQALHNQSTTIEHLHRQAQLRRSIERDLTCPNQPASLYPGTFFDYTEDMSLLEPTRRVVLEFDYPQHEVNRAVTEFLSQMDDGLSRPGATLQQIPTFVTGVPNGTEKGLYMSVDLGGTNFRVCSVQLHGNTTFTMTHSKVPVPQSLMTAKTSKELFSFLAKQIQVFLKQHHSDHYQGHLERRGNSSKEIFSLGFTFSFPVHQTAINRGTLVRWTKGFNILDTIGQDVCQLLQKEIDALGLPVKVVALVNDTVGTLMARSYTSPGKTGTLLGAIFGTGTNGAYVEKLDRITKLSKMKDVKGYDSTTGEMIVNAEWGSFDNTMRVLPNTSFDADLDGESLNPGDQMFEKRVSGMFLGEILRRVILKLYEDPDVPLFTDTDSNANDLHSTTSVAPDSALYKQWGLDTSFLSTTSGDNSPGLRLTRQALEMDLGVSAPSAEDAVLVKDIATAIGRRAARLSAVAIGAVIISSGRLENRTGNREEDVIDVGVDGSLVEFYPHFEQYIREALREIPAIGVEGEQRTRIGIAKDGSGVGAALIALVADQMGVQGAGGEGQPSRLDDGVQSGEEQQNGMKPITWPMIRSYLGL